MMTKSPAADAVERSLATTALEIAVARAATWQGEAVNLDLLAKSVVALKDAAGACGEGHVRRFDDRLRALQAELDGLAADLAEYGAPAAAQRRTGTGA